MYFMIGTFSEQKTQMHNRETLVMKISAFFNREQIKIKHLFFLFSRNYISEYPHSFSSQRKTLPHRKMPANKCRVIELENLIS